MVELMVVVIIMAVLGLAIMPDFNGKFGKGEVLPGLERLDAITNAFTAFTAGWGSTFDKWGSKRFNNRGMAVEAFSVPGSDAKVNAEELFQSFLGTPLADLWEPLGQ